MGKGDIKSKKGKRWKGSYGKRRLNPQKMRRKKKAKK